MPRQSRRTRRLVPGAFHIFVSALTAGLHCAAVNATSGNANFTIDDASSPNNFHTHPETSSSAPTNTSIPQWAHQDCTTCPSKPDLTAVNGGTYTVVYLPAGSPFQYNISFEFQGSAIYVYLILSDQAPTTCEFYLDGESKSYTGKSAGSYQYNTLAFSKSGLDPHMHQLKITAVGQISAANYINFDFANFTRPVTVATPSPTPTNPHTTVKAIAGGVVGGFIAVLALIIAAAFYRHRRLRELEAMAHPFIGNTADGSNTSSPNEQQHLIPLSFSQSSLGNHRPDNNSNSNTATSTSTNTTVTPFILNPRTHDQSQSQSQSHSRSVSQQHPEYRDQLRLERQYELNNRLETVTTQIRSLKSSYMQGHQRLLQRHATQQQQQQQPQSGKFYPPDSNQESPPVIRLVPDETLEPITNHRHHHIREESTVNPQVLLDMQEQMGLMMDQIQYLRTQQNSAYVQGLTDEPPPGYMDTGSVRITTGRRDT